MELRQYFAKRTWWGKLIGAFFGYLIAGPMGALFGLLVGNFFDRGLAEHFSKPYWHYFAEQDQAVRHVFFESMFTILGHIAKTDGRISEEAIQQAKQIMNQMELNAAQKIVAQKYFNAGKNTSFNLYSMLGDLQKAIGSKPTLIRLFIEAQYQFIRQTGITKKKLDIMNNLLACMRLAPLQQQQHFSEEFSWYSTTQNAYQQQRSSSNQQRSSSNQHHSSSNQRQQYHQPHYNHENVDDAYTVLGIKSTASQPEVKRAYRRRISLNHPDKLIAKGLPESAIKLANEKTQRIRKAYEQICALRGW
ncbi:MAG: co-chaperone DjlA [Legionellaceae bacterium]|nr:co-chaperone DjlA [Legionellaceae bacterium]